MSTDLDLDLQKLVGERLQLEVDAPKDKVRYFQGRCVATQYLGAHADQGYFRATVRPWLWFLTRTSNCRIFQDKSVVDIIKDIFGQHGFSDFKDRTKHRYAQRKYCVQFRESDFDFISRLMEEEGIYYYHSHDKTKETLILADEASSHKAVEDQTEIDFYLRSGDYRRSHDHVFEWRGGESIQTGKVTLQDYDFEKPKSDLRSVKALSKGRHSFNKYEHYAYPGRHDDVKTGEHHARVKVEGFAAASQRSHGVCNVRQMTAGAKFKLKKHPRKSENAEYLVVAARHQLQIDSESEDADIVNAILGPLLDFDSNTSSDMYRCVIEVQPIKEPFRAPQVTSRPDNPGVQTAEVVGKHGEEIWTDKYGRVKVQFHWDRDGKKDENASCWVRTAVPWSGKNWGMMAVPRVGQEVVVQFENGDPDRPIITGMVYNGDTKVPHPLPANQTQMGLKTNTSKDGGGFSELIFEDKKDAEFVRLQSERDFRQIVKNNAEITVGLEHKKEGFFKQTIHGNKTETINEGDHQFTVAKGAEKIDIAKNRDTTIGGSDALTIDADQKMTIKGGQTTSITKAYEIDVGAALEVSAKSKITLKCGGSKIEMTPTKVTISTTQIDIKAEATARLTANGQLKMEGKGQAALKGAGMLKLEGGGMTQLKSSGLLSVKGSLTMIN
ncbi:MULTISPECIES: type VI secretion system Vgr family protein [Rhodobacterales]|uniref:type VI secretion system Vgr family protein n=1 Tax=Rhodobacterales TaxID=204455 RepID=UPI00215DB8A0|nr:MULTISPECIES: type VI secretion system tip protein TssI/VgrG [Rhodobacterales]MDO6590550.1 type VI secretion system tip protein TssI/VgrG [Yoonia sp. 1_MG-2023]